MGPLHIRGKHVMFLASFLSDGICISLVVALSFAQWCLRLRRMRHFLLFGCDRGYGREQEAGIVPRFLKMLSSV